MENTYFTIKPALQIMNELQVTSSSTLLLFSAFATQLTKNLTYLALETLPKNTF